MVITIGKLLLQGAVHDAVREAFLVALEAALRDVLLNARVETADYNGSRREIAAIAAILAASRRELARANAVLAEVIDAHSRNTRR